MADDIKHIKSGHLCAAQIDAMRVEGFHLRRCRAIGKQLLVRTLLRGIAGVERPSRRAIGINQLESGTGRHSTCDQPACARNGNQVFRILSATYEIQSVRRRSRQSRERKKAARLEEKTQTSQGRCAAPVKW